MTTHKNAELRKEIVKELEDALLYMKTCADVDVPQHIRDHVFRITNEFDDSIDLRFKEACISCILPDCGNVNGDPEDQANVDNVVSLLYRTYENS